MKVLDARVLVQPEKNKGCTQKIGGIEIPVGGGDYETATVVSVGEKIDSEVLKPGDKVYIYPSAGKKIFHEGVEYRVISSSEIIVVL